MLVTMTAIWVMITLYSNERVLTPEVIARLAMGGGGMAMPRIKTADSRAWSCSPTELCLSS
jgi:hypothetical protein